MIVYDLSKCYSILIFWTGTSKTPFFWNCCSEWCGRSIEVNADVKILFVLRWPSKVRSWCHIWYLLHTARWSS